MYFMWLQGRPQGIDANQEAFVHDSPGNVQSFLDAVNTIKPTAIIGKESPIFCVHVTSKPVSTGLSWLNLKLSAKLHETGEAYVL